MSLHLKLQKLNQLSDAIVRAKKAVLKDKSYNSALNLQSLQKQYTELKNTIPPLRRVK